MRRVGLGLLVFGLGLAGMMAAAVLAGTHALPGGSTDTATTASTTLETTTAATTLETTSETITTTAATTTAPATTAPRPRPRSKPATIPAGVRVGNVAVGGLTTAAAERTVRASFARPLVLIVGRERLRLSAARLGAVPYIETAVARALHALPGSTVTLTIAVRGAAGRAWVKQLAKRFDRKAVDATVHLWNLRPFVTQSRVGRRLRQASALRTLFAALRENRRAPLRLPIRALTPAAFSNHFGPVIVIRRGSNLLFLYNGVRFVRRFHVATGQSSYPTPLGRWEIVVMARNPWWFPPASPWAEGKQPVPPGPGNPLGTRWMGLSAPGVGIHGTPDAASIGYSASHGCIRMLIADAEWLFGHVRIGTPVFVVPA